MRNSREDKILNTYRTKGAFLVDDHGVLTNNGPLPKPKVPKDTVIIFLPQTGYCMAIQDGQVIQRLFFESKSDLEKFFKSGRVSPSDKHYHHVTNLLSKTYFEGDEFDNMTVQLEPDKHYKNMGFIKKLPSLRKSTIHTPTITPTFAETAGPIHSGTYRLSTLIKSYFPKGGVFVVSACRAGHNIPALLNMPGHRKMIPRGTNTSRIVTQSAIKPPKKGYSGATHLPNFPKANNLKIKKMYGGLKRHTIESRIKRIEHHLYEDRSKIGREYRTMRNLLGAVGMRANFSRSHPTLLRKWENNFYKAPNNMMKLRTRKISKPRQKSA